MRNGKIKVYDCTLVVDTIPPVVVIIFDNSAFYIQIRAKCIQGVEKSHRIINKIL